MNLIQQAKYDPRAKQKLAFWLVGIVVIVFAVVLAVVIASSSVSEHESQRRQAERAETLEKERASAQKEQARELREAQTRVESSDVATSLVIMLALGLLTMAVVGYLLLLTKDHYAPQQLYHHVYDESGRFIGRCEAKKQTSWFFFWWSDGE